MTRRSPAQSSGPGPSPTSARRTGWSPRLPDIARTPGASRLHSGEPRLERRRRRRIRVQAHPDPRRRVRPGSKGAPRPAARPFLGLGDEAPEQRGRVRRDRRVAPRAGLQALARSSTQPDRAALPRGCRRACECCKESRAARRPSRGAALLHACDRGPGRRVPGDDAGATTAPRDHDGRARRAAPGVRRAHRGGPGGCGDRP